ncbi:hypothetical protein RM531_08130 [Salinisphaera sp. P385]|uniref:Uncharacterized protein n=1 Tax=Spectribacter acetivorans TaxID=3075603 RepID=A0ABU3B7K2_9GAMM|nr:hypothetical protein [Salinisphaera sp. P385]MDT0618442.1 hypothetical protein [Salinisphaera sp. P385]
MEFYPYTYKLPEFDHTPVRGPRANHPEAVFHRCWVELMATPPVDPFDDDVGSIDPPPNARFVSIFEDAVAENLNQRHATVAASMVAWLGTNCGQGLLASAQALWEQLSIVSNPPPRETVFEMALSEENRRMRIINGGMRLIEHLLAPDDCLCEYNGGVSMSRDPELRFSDYEILAQVMRWVGSEQGQAFIDHCLGECRSLPTLEEIVAASG